MASSTIHSTSSASMTDDSNARPVTVKVPIKLTPRSVQAEYHIAEGMFRRRSRSFACDLQFRSGDLAVWRCKLARTFYIR